MGALPDRAEMSSKGMLMSIRDFIRHGVNLIRSSFIGTFVGILPGIGASIGSVIAYTVAKKCILQSRKIW